jgi:DNA-directed RNA polymerase specialized sigma24 family protein
VSEEAQRVSEAMDAIEAIADPAERVRSKSKVMAEQAQRFERWKKERREMVLALREQGMSYRKIAAQVGAPLGTVQDIVRGYTGSWGDRAKKEPPTTE